MEQLSSQEVKCTLCGSTLKTKNGSTTCMNRHLTSRHQIQFEEEKNKRKPQDITPRYTPFSVDDALIEDDTETMTKPEPSSSATAQVTSAATSMQIQPTISSAMESQTPYAIRHPRKMMLDRKVLDLIVVDMQPLSIVEDKAFRALVYALDKRYSIIARSTLRDRLLPKVYNDRKSALFKELITVDHVGITTDQWTSRATEGYTTVTCHYIRSDWSLASPVLATRSSGARHTGENMAKELIEIFKQFGISNKVTTVVTDNAKNAKKSVRITAKDNQPCFAHTLNLIVTHALEDDESCDDIKSIKDIVQFFRMSVQATKELRDIHLKNETVFRKLKNSVKTRWNSTYTMLQSYLPQHKEIKSVLCMQDRHDLVITDAAVGRLTKTMETLEPFFLVTEELSSEKHTSISKILTVVKILRSNTEDKADKLSQSLHKYIDLYLGASEARPLLRQASFLDPRYRDYGFSNKDSQDKTREEIKTKMMDMKPEEDDLKKKSEPSPAKKTNSFWKLFDNANDTDDLMESTQESIIDTELKMYCESPRLHRLSNPLQWWKRQSMRLPNISKLAKQILAVPATSVPSERVFSKAGELISARRSRLGKDNVDMILFLNKFE